MRSLERMSERPRRSRTINKQRDLHDTNESWTTAEQSASDRAA